jgi:3-oxoadipate enol-lactonase
MPIFESAGASLYFERHGEGPALVLAHGIGGNHAAWFQQIPVLSQSYEVITFDHRGFGRSSDADERGRGAFADDLAAILDHLQVQRCVLIGQSMGGGTCVGFAARHPQRVAALVLADTIQGLAEPPEVQRIMAAARQQNAPLTQLERVLSDATRAQRPAMATLYSQIAGFNARDRHNLGGEFAPLLDPQALGSLGFPTLFIVGADDRLFPPTAVLALQAHVPNSFYVEVSESGHSAYFEQAEIFNDAILSFLQAVGFKGRRRPAHSNVPGYRKVGS